jgi:hypothetical protein
MATQSAIFVLVNIVVSPFCQSSHVGSLGICFAGPRTKVTCSVVER